VENIDHTKIKVTHPKTDGICEHFHQTIKNESYDVAFGKKVYTSIEELQGNVDDRVNEFNSEQPHSGKYCFPDNADANVPQLKTPCI
jgi:hypothetical protein